MGRFSKTINKHSKEKQQIYITPAFKKRVKEFIDEHADALKELAKR